MVFMPALESASLLCTCGVQSGSSKRWYGRDSRMLRQRAIGNVVVFNCFSFHSVRKQSYAANSLKMQQNLNK